MEFLILSNTAKKVIKTTRRKTVDYARFCISLMLNEIFSGTFMLTEIYQGVLASNITGNSCYIYFT